MTRFYRMAGREMRVDGALLKIASIEGEGYSFFDSPLDACRAAAQLKPRVDLFTFLSRIKDSELRLDFYTELDNVAALPISTFEEWFTNKIDFRARNKARKAEKKGVVIREVPFSDGLLRGISEIYNEMPIRQGRKFPHYGRDFESLKRIKSTFLDRSVFIGAYLGEDLIGFIKLVWSEDRCQAGLMHILSMHKHRDKAPTNALLAQAVKSCAARSISYLWYAKYQYGNKEEDGLAAFKASNGFAKIEIPRFYVPLTPLGKIALAAGLHHSMRDHLPDSISSVYRSLRQRWYARV